MLMLGTGVWKYGGLVGGMDEWSSSSHVIFIVRPLFQYPPWKLIA